MAWTYTKSCLFIHPLMDIWAVFQCLTITNEAARGVCAQVFAWTQTSIYLGLGGNLWVEQLDQKAGEC